MAQLLGNPVIQMLMKSVLVMMTQQKIAALFQEAVCKGLQYITLGILFECQIKNEGGMVEEPRHHMLRMCDFEHISSAGMVTVFPTMPERCQVHATTFTSLESTMSTSPTRDLAGATQSSC